MSAGALINPLNTPSSFVGTMGVPTDFGDLVSANYQAGLTNYNSNSEWATLRDKLTVSFEDYTAATGETRYKFFPLDLTAQTDPHLSTFIPGGIHATGGYSSDPADFELYDAEIARLKAEDPVRYSKLKTFSEIQESALAQSRKDKSTLDNAIYRAAPGTSVFGAAMVGGLGAASQDPLNVMTTLIGAGAAASLIRTFAIEAGINMATEAAIQPHIMAYQEKLGQDYSNTDAAVAIIGAGLFGGGLSVAMKGGGRAVTRMLANNDDIPVALRDEARHAENNHHTEDGNPAAPKDMDAHVRDYVRASRDLANGRNVDLSAQSSVAYARWLETVDQDTKRMWDEVTSGADVDEVTTGRLVEQLTKWRDEIIDDPVYANLTRKEVKDLQAQIKQVEYTLAHPKKLADAKREIKEAYPEISAREAEKMAKMEAAETTQGLKNLKASLLDRIDNGTEVKVLDGEIMALRQGVVPKRHRETVNTMKEGIRALDKEYKAFDLKTVERVGDEIQQTLDEMNVTPSRAVDPEKLDEAVAHKESAEYEKEMFATFDALLTRNPDEVITHPDTGESLTVRELSDEIEADNREFSQISSCGVNR